MGFDTCQSLTLRITRGHIRTVKIDSTFDPLLINLGPTLSVTSPPRKIKSFRATTSTQQVHFYQQVTSTPTTDKATPKTPRGRRFRRTTAVDSDLNLLATTFNPFHHMPPPPKPTTTAPAPTPTHPLSSPNRTQP